MSDYVKLMSILIVTQERLINELQELVTVTAKRGDVDKHLERVINLTTEVHKLNVAMEEEGKKIDDNYRTYISELGLSPS